jgi:hypothetical protein
MYPLTIIVTGYNRPHALKSLFESMSKLYVAPSLEIPLIISIDNKGTEEVNRLANEYKWPFGTKEVIIHQEKKGLINHFIWVGDQSLKYEYVLFLEDDLIVSPDMINYALQVIDFYKDDDRIAGACLYNTLYTLRGLRFHQIQDGHDNYFFQHPYWGNIWFKNKWIEFKEYLKSYTEKKELLPIDVAIWTESFKKIYIQYLIELDKTMIVPRISLVSNNGIAGLHTQNTITWQTPFVVSINNKYKFSTYDQSFAKYDAFEELYVEILKRMNPLLTKYDFEVDTKCSKRQYTKPYVITYCHLSKYTVAAYSSATKPVEVAIGLNIKGNDICLIQSAKVKVVAKKLSKIRCIDLNKNVSASKKIMFQSCCFALYNYLKRKFILCGY